MRLARFVALMHGPALVAHGVVAVGLTRLVAWPSAVAIAFAVWAVTALRMGTLLRDWRRRRWVVRFVDEPVFWHWGACLFAVPPFVVAAPVALVARAVAGPAHALPVSTVALACYALGLVIAGWGIWG